MAAPVVDLNADVGESFGAYRIGSDEDLAESVTSFNIACGWHAGDPLVMERTVRLALRFNIGIGAHPGYPDLLGFGRRGMEISSSEANAYVLYQLGALQAFAQAAGSSLQHVKLHGALYNKAAVDEKLGQAVLDAVAQFDPTLIVVGLSGSPFLQMAAQRGLQVAHEVFADRAYNPDGTLVARGRPGRHDRRSRYCRRQGGPDGLWTAWCRRSTDATFESAQTQSVFTATMRVPRISPVRSAGPWKGQE